MLCNKINYLNAFSMNLFLWRHLLNENAFLSKSDISNTHTEAFKTIFFSCTLDKQGNTPID